MSWRYVVPGDRAELEAGFLRLSAESRYRRFHSTTDQLPPAVWDRMIGSVDQIRHIAIVTMVEEEGVAIAHVVRDPVHPHTADIGVTVIDEWQGRGVGSVILRQVLALAGDIEAIETHVLADNRAALRLLEKLGPLTLECGQGQCRARVDLASKRSDGHVMARSRARHNAVGFRDNRRTARKGRVAVENAGGPTCESRRRRQKERGLRRLNHAIDEATLLDPRAAGELLAIQRDSGRDG
jgi:GNAT superfamily N-acetyltransferase